MSLKPVKVVHILNTLGIGGAENCVRLLVRHLDQSRFLSLVICTWSGGAYVEDLVRHGIPVKVLNRKRRSILLFPLFCWDVLTTLGDLYRLLIQEKPDILQTHLPVSAYLGIIAGKLAHIPHLIFTFHSSNLIPKRGKRSLRNWLRLKLVGFLCLKVEIIVAVSKAIMGNILPVIPNQGSRLRLIPNGIDVARFNQGATGKKIRDELGMDQGSFLITTIGNLRMEKNQAMLLKVVSRLIKVHPMVRVLIVGEGSLRTQLMDLRKELGLTEYVYFLGQRQDIHEILAETNIFVNTSLWEGLPLSILEAMAARIPVVATAVPGVLEVLEENSGILVGLDDLMELEQALLGLIVDPERRSALGEKGRKRVEGHYSLEVFVKRWEALYEELICDESQAL